MTARDVMYGRRGGGWLPKSPARPSSKPKKRRFDELHRCDACSEVILGLEGRKELPDPLICHRLECRARAFWTADDWAGRARMAAARLAAGVGLDALDLRALREHPQPMDAAA